MYVSDPDSDILTPPLFFILQNIRTRSTSQWCGNTPTFWSFGNNGCTKYPGRIGLTDWKTKSKFTIKPVYKKNDPKPWYKIIAKNNCAAKYVTAEPGVGDLPLSFDQDTSTDGLFRIDAFDKTSNAADCVSDIYIISGQGEGFFLDSYCDEFEVTEDGPSDNSKWMVIGV